MGCEREEEAKEQGPVWRHKKITCKAGVQRLNGCWYPGGEEGEREGTAVGSMEFALAAQGLNDPECHLYCRAT